MLVVYSKIRIDDADRRRIEGIRQAHDPSQALVGPHFTLVFPFTGVDTDEVASHLRSVIRGQSPIPFRLTRTAVVPVGAGPRSYVFLVPSAGENELCRLHADLHTGPLAGKRPSFNFLPHVTVAVMGSPAQAARIAASLDPIDIAGEVATVNLAELDGATLADLHSFPLR